MKPTEAVAAADSASARKQEAEQEAERSLIAEAYELCVA